MKKRLLSFITVIIMLLSLCSCMPRKLRISYDKNYVPDPNAAAAEWSIYWYLCGSDLESEYGAASKDMSEMFEVSLPEGINVVIQTGGAKKWYNNFADSSGIQRWLYDSNGLHFLEKHESANMGDSRTLCDFLQYADENFPAKKTAVIFWNHGGGSVAGVAYDEIYDFDSLDINEMHAAFNEVWPADPDSPALELVGFDACLMATVDVAAALKDFASYLVASEEEEPATGWLYSGFLGELAKDPSMDGETLGRIICDTFYEDCEIYNVEAKATLSLTDLAKTDALLSAYEQFGREALLASAIEPGFFAEFGREAIRSENYGGNTREQGYSNMVDLGHFARQTAWLLPSAQSVCDALDECVLYKVSGPYRSEATGLSCYYSYNGDPEDLNGYMNFGTSDAFKQLYSMSILGEADEKTSEFLSSYGITEISKAPSIADMEWENAPFTIDDEGVAHLDLGPEAQNILSDIGFSLFFKEEGSDQIIFLGTDNDLDADWENGVFSDNFRGVWGAIDGHYVFMELSFQGDDYNLYSVPILLNSEEYHLQVVYDFDEQVWSILGATPGLDHHLGMASKELRQLEEGDEITTILKISSLDGEGDMGMMYADRVEVTQKTSFAEKELVDGTYYMVFEMRDAIGNFATSDLICFDCIDGDIYTYAQ